MPLAAEEEAPYRTPEEVEREIARLKNKMLEAAALAFEDAAKYRDEIRALQELEMQLFPESGGLPGNTSRA